MIPVTMDAATRDTLVAFAFAHVKLMVRHETVKAACRLGVEPDPTMIDAIAGSITWASPEMDDPTDLNSTLSLADSTGRPLIPVIEKLVYEWSSSDNGFKRST